MEPQDESATLFMLRSNQATSTALNSERVAATSPLQTAAVLVVDDSRTMRRLLIRALNDLGLQNITEAADGNEALSLAASKSFDLVLLDMEMPEIDGLQVLYRLKQDPLTRTMPVIIISGQDQFENTVKCIEIGAEDYLPKPFNPVLLRARVMSSLEKKRLRDDDADYPALLIGNYILGSGALSSRLGTRIRQQEGLSYSVGSSLGVSSQDQRATFTISAICNPANIGRVEKCAREELDRMLKDGVTKTELDQARQGYLQAVKVGRSSDTAIMGQLGSLRNLGRTMAWQTEQEKRILALTPESVLAALRKHLDPSKLVVVTAGDFEAKPAGGNE